MAEPSSVSPESHWGAKVSECGADKSVGVEESNVEAQGRSGERLVSPPRPE